MREIQKVVLNFEKSSSRVLSPEAPKAGCQSLAVAQEAFDNATNREVDVTHKHFDSASGTI